MIDKAFAVGIIGFCLIAPASADNVTTDSEEERYLFDKVAGGFVRLDTQTGEVAFCSQRSVGWACQAAPEDRAAFENEIERLRRENAALKKDLLTHGLPLPTGTMQEPPVAGDGSRPPQAERRSDLDRVLALVDRAWRRLVEAIARAERQMLKKS